MAPVTARFGTEEANRDPLRRERVRMCGEYAAHTASARAAAYPQSRDLMSSPPGQFSGVQAQPSVQQSICYPVGHLRHRPPTNHRPDPSRAR